MTLDSALKAVANQEAELVFERFDEKIALGLGLEALALAESRGHAIWVNISRGDHTLFEHSMAGTSPANADFGSRKKSVVHLMHFSSVNFFIHKQNGFNFVDFMNLDSRVYGTYGGSFPIRVEGAGVIGSITISGLSDLDDHNLVVEVLNAHLGCSAELLSL